MKNATTGKSATIWILLLLVGVGLAAACGSSQKKAPETPAQMPAPAAAPEPQATPEPQPPPNGVYGTVMSGGQPVANASVMIPELNAKHSVGADGTYSIELEPTGQLRTLVFTAPGYLPVEKKITVPAGKPLSLKIELAR